MQTRLWKRARVLDRGGVKLGGKAQEVDQSTVRGSVTI